MNGIARFAVARPVFTTMVTLIIIVLGGISLSRLAIDLMPDITYPTLSIRTSYGQAGPQEVESLITRPIEQAIAAVPGVEEISSSSVEGLSNVRVSFVWGTDLNEAANDLRDRLDRVIANLPEEAERPMLRKFDLASAPVLIMGASSGLDPVQMQELLENQVRYRIERVDGVAALNIWGGLERQVHVDVHPGKAKALDLPLEEIVERLRAANVNVPAGSLQADGFEVAVRTPGEFESFAELEDTVVAERGGASIRLRDVARIRDGIERVTRIVRVNGEPGLRLSVNKQSGTNTVEVARLVREEVERINRDLPQVRLRVLIDTSEYIRGAVASVGQSLLYGGIFSVLVLLFFLRSLRSTLVVAAAIPVSIIATFLLVYFGGFTLNIMTIGGLALGVGMLVDNAIVVLENIYRLREQGMEPRRAAVTGAGEVSGAIVASTLTTLVVFLPMVFTRGIAGIMFQQLAFVVGFSLLCSLAVALTLVPMLASTVVTGDCRAGVCGVDAPWHMRVAAAIGGWLERLEGAYKRLLHYCLARRGASLGVAGALLAGSLALVPLIGTEMMPETDEGEVRVYMEMEVGTSLEVLSAAVAPVEATVRREVPEAEDVIALLGSSGWRRSGSHIGQLRISLVGPDERERTSHQIAADLRRKLSGMPGMKIRTRSNQELFVLRMVARDSDDQLEVQIRGYDLETANALANEVLTVVRATPGVSDARVSRDEGAPERLVRIDRARAESMGVPVRRAAELLKTAIAGTRAGSYRVLGDEYPIMVRIAGGEAAPLRDLLDLTVRGHNGQPVVLRNIVRVEEGIGPTRIERKDQERVITVSANIAGMDMGTVATALQQGLEALPVPQGFAVAISGDWEQQQEAFAELLVTFVLSLVLVYMVMACLYESLREPLVVMFSVPLAIIGVCIMLFVTHTTFNMQSYIGCIMLGGIIVNNAILLVDQTGQLRRDGMFMREAIEEAGRRRVRPILMTTLTTIFGLAPLALGLGEGGETQAPMARAVIGGLASSTLVTLVVVPVVYSLLAKKDAPDSHPDSYHAG